MLSPFRERFGGQSPKVLASTKGARFIFYGTSRRLLTKGVCLHGPGDCPPHPLFEAYTLFDGPAEQLSPLCVWLGGRWVNRRPESKSRPVTDDGVGGLDGLVNGAIQTSWYVDNDAFGQAFVLTAANIRLQGLPAANLAGNDA
jgi:hypothetical protein